VDILVVTQWGGGSLVKTELCLLQTAMSRFPRARQFLVVSGDTVHFFDYFLEDEEKDVSTMTCYNDVFPERQEDIDALCQVGIAQM
jgi:hypothetical protein